MHSFDLHQKTKAGVADKEAESEEEGEARARANPEAGAVVMAENEVQEPKWIEIETLN